ncbi:hypothetical protein [Amycolatopsis jejuensis]|uniref:phosphotriesterase family protein n=1 Tax=Amycolatopsis jejuensis TaxID=330084 RepID=UPI000527E325|nr:hypothetical protein [Amycolatopsis jejuensis]
MNLSAFAPSDWVINTVTGPVAADEVGYVLAHEHVCVDAHGPAHDSYLDVDWEATSRHVVAELGKLRAVGVSLLVDWTAIGMGRNILFLRDVSKRSGVKIAAATGVGAGALPPSLSTATTDELAKVFVDELRSGIENTPVTATFIKVTALDGGPTSAERRVLVAAAQAASMTGAALCVHALDFAAFEQAFRLVSTDLLDPRQIVWGHGEFSSGEEHLTALRWGVNLQFDGMSVQRPEPYALADPEKVLLDQVSALCEAGYGDRVLVSNDASLARLPDPAYSGNAATLITDFVPLMKARLGAEATQQILMKNPLRIFGRRVSARCRRRLPHEAF